MLTPGDADRQSGPGGDTPELRSQEQGAVAGDAPGSLPQRLKLSNLLTGDYQGAIALDAQSSQQPWKKEDFEVHKRAHGSQRAAKDPEGQLLGFACWDESSRLISVIKLTCPRTDVAETLLTELVQKADKALKVIQLSVPETDTDTQILLRRLGFCCTMTYDLEPKDGAKGQSFFFEYLSGMHPPIVLTPKLEWENAD